MRALLGDNWIRETGNRVAQGRAKKPDTQLGHSIWTPADGP
jgi:hypothetical protein